jgi:aspartyl-tRNA(Asn)/glutamyl-tRNA(Gln) amidotransferase subunit C
MSLTITDAKKIAHLARLDMPEEELIRYTEQLSHILSLVDQMNRADTAHIEPLANPLNLSQRLREDIVIETNQRDSFQAIAPQVEAGLYIVPQVLEGE